MSCGENQALEIVQEFIILTGPTQRQLKQSKRKSSNNTMTKLDKTANFKKVSVTSNSKTLENLQEWVAPRREGPLSNNE